MPSRDGCRPGAESDRAVQDVCENVEGRTDRLNNLAPRLEVEIQIENRRPGFNNCASAQRLTGYNAYVDAAIKVPAEGNITAGIS